MRLSRSPRPASAPPDQKAAHPHRPPPSPQGRLAARCPSATRHPPPRERWAHLAQSRKAVWADQPVSSGQPSRSSPGYRNERILTQQKTTDHRVPNDIFNRGSRSLLITTLASGCGSSISARDLVGSSCNTGGEENPDRGRARKTPMGGSCIQIDLFFSGMERSRLIRCRMRERSSPGPGS